MLTIFTIPKSFRDDINIIQRNAIKSWTLLKPKCEIILFGDEEGVAEAVSEFGVQHVPEIKKNEFGTPLLNSVFNLAQKLAKNQILVYINADVILMSDFILAVQQIKKPLFLLSSRRWDLNIKEPIQFNETDWEAKLHNRIAVEGKLHGPSGIEYFVFPREFQHNFPPFTVGRPGWDNWLIYQTRSSGVSVIDATKVITVIHQSHESSHIRVKKDISKKIEAQKNLKLAAGFSHMLTLRDADLVLTSQGLKKPKFPRRIFAALSLFYPWRLAFAIKRKLEQFFL